MFKATGPEFYPVFNAPTVHAAIHNYAAQFGSVYPSEMWCESALVDLAAMTERGELYAFEIKEKGDSVIRGIEQCKVYLSGFDRVYLAGTVKPNHRTLMRIERLGFGYVQVRFEEDAKHARIHALLIAPLNHPIPTIRAHIMAKFQRARVKLNKPTRARQYKHGSRR